MSSSKRGGEWFAISLSPLLSAPHLLSAICKAASDNHVAFLHFFSWGWFWSLPPEQCYNPPSIVLQTLCLSELIPLNLLVIYTVIS